MNPFTFVKHALGGNVKMDEFKREFRAGDVYGALDALVRTQEKIMSAITDLQAAVTALQAAVTAASGALANPTTDDAAVEAQVTAINAATAALTAATPVAAPVAGTAASA